MAGIYDKTLFGGSPYYDDFDENQKFLRILSRPGYALQAREITQLQTIIQKQIERFGNHIFEDGSIVTGGQITENYVNFARIPPANILNTTTSLSFENKVVWVLYDSFNCPLKLCVITK